MSFRAPSRVAETLIELHHCLGFACPILLPPLFPFTAIRSWSGDLTDPIFLPSFLSYHKQVLPPNKPLTDLLLSQHLNPRGPQQTATKTRKSVSKRKWSAVIWINGSQVRKGERTTSEFGKMKVTENLKVFPGSGVNQTLLKWAVGWMTGGEGTETTHSSLTLEVLFPPRTNALKEQY